jgi:tetratricopeptide (TPR) repeat protein
MNLKPWALISVAVTTIVFASSACTGSKRYLERGQKAFDAGKYEDAAIDFRNAIQKDRNLGEAYYKLGLAELRAEKFPDAYQALLRAVELLPDSQEAKVSLANLCVQSYAADPRRPKVLYDQLVKLEGQMAAKNPNGYDTLRFRGYLALIDRKLQEGIVNLEKANEADPLQPDVVVPLMQALIQDQRFPEAEKLGQETIQKHKENARIYDVLYTAYMASNRSEQAESVLKAEMVNNPKHAEYALALAVHYARLQKNSEANATIRGLLEHAAELPQVYLWSGDFYAGSGNWEEATKLYTEGAKHYPKDNLVYQKKITNVLLAQDKKEQAARTVDGILREAPKDQEALRLRALLLMTDRRQPENLDKALTELEDVVKQSPSDVLSRFHLARAYVVKGDLEDARKELSEILRQNQAFLPAHLMLADIASQKEQPGEILSHVTPVLAAEPSNQKARLLEAIALMLQGKSVEARSRLNRLISDQPKYVDAQLELGLFDLADKKYQDAEIIFRKFYQFEQTRPRALEGLVNVFVARGQPGQAVRLLQEEVKRSERPGPLRVTLAKTAAQAGRDDLAVEQLRQAVKENPTSYEVQAMLGDFFSRKGDLDQAIETYEKACELAPKDPTPHLLLASVQDRAGHKPEATASYRSALKLQPDNPVLLNNLAFYLAENGGNLDEALSMAQLAVQKLSGQPDLSDTLGWIYLKKNMPDAALRIFNTLVGKNPKSPVFRYHLAAALAAKGDKAGARSALNDALTRNPSKQDEARIRELLARLG